MMSMTRGKARRRATQAVMSGAGTALRRQRSEASRRAGDQRLNADGDELSRLGRGKIYN